MKKPYHIVTKDAQSASRSIQEFAQANGQILAGKLMMRLEFTGAQ